jgi:hypothetical protein
MHDMRNFNNIHNNKFQVLDDINMQGGSNNVTESPAQLQQENFSFILCGCGKPHLPGKRARHSCSVGDAHQSKGVVTSFPGRSGLVTIKEGREPTLETLTPSSSRQPPVSLVSKAAERKGKGGMHTHSLFSPQVLGLERLKTILDSGANEFMVKSLKFSQSLNGVETNIQTAGGSVEKGVVGTMQSFVFADGRTDVKFGHRNFAVFAEGLVDNLSSVGRLCEAGFSVVFDKFKCRIFLDKNFKVEGQLVHAEGRDPRTGFYPLTIYRKDSTGCSPNLGPRFFDRVGVEEVRVLFAQFRPWALAACETVRHNLEVLGASEECIFNVPNDPAGFLAKFYIKEGMSDYQRWHDKLGHLGSNILRKCGIPVPKRPFRCEACNHGKIHRLGHSSRTVQKEPVYLPGECIHTDLQGPYVRSFAGHKYSQIFIDVASRKVWTVQLGKKTDSNEAIRKVLHEARIRSGRRLKYLRADGDGIFGRSANFQSLAQAEGFIHEKPAPYDHQQSALIDRECRSLLEAVNTALYQSGAPSNFWGEAAQHYTFTRNNIPRHEVLKNGKRTFISPNNMFEGIFNPYSLKHLVAFGTQATCCIPPERRNGRKTPGQQKAFDGVIVGYVVGSSAIVSGTYRPRK